MNENVGFANPEETNLFTQGAELSLRNAEQWIKDAKLLIEHSSFGHASALLRFAIEEVGKAIVCWFVSKRFLPPKSETAKNIFKFHSVKNQITLQMLFSILLSTPSVWPKEIPKPKDEDLIITITSSMEYITSVMEKDRQNAIYVDLNHKQNRVLIPQAIAESEVRRLLQGAEFSFEIAEVFIKKLSEPTIEEVRRSLEPLLNEIRKTGRFPKELFEKKNEGVKS